MNGRRSKQSRRLARRITERHERDDFLVYRPITVNGNETGHSMLIRQGVGGLARKMRKNYVRSVA